MESIAIVGASALFPGSVDKTGFWTDILGGKDLITDVPATHFLIDDYYDADPSKPDKTYARRGGFLPDVDFDALSWGVPPSIVPQTDTSQLLALIVAQRVLEDAYGSQFADVDRSRMSCILGVTSAQELLGEMNSRLQRPVWVKALRESGIPEDEVEVICDRIAASYTPWEESTFPGLLGNVVAGRIANRLNLGGTNCVTDAACASSFSALAMGVSELLLGDSDVVLCGGVDTMNDIFMFMCFSKTPALSRSGDVRPFSDNADGTMLGEGLGMVALKRLSDAERDGNRIYAVIRGVGSSSDGRSKSVYAPVSAGQASSINRAYDKAGYGAETVELVEAHGTGTLAGDAAEFGGLRMVFEASGRTGAPWCALGSVKSQIGHTKAAAGAAGLFKAVMALHHKSLPPTIKIDQPSPKLGITESPFYLPATARPWVRGSAHPRRAGVSSFGFGGSNFHIALEEYVGEHRAARLRTFDRELVVAVGDDVAAACARARDLADQAPVAGLRHLAWATRNERGAARIVVLANEAELADKLRRAADRAADGPFSSPDGTWFGVGEADGALAMLYPGQGSQYLGMGAALAQGFDAAMAGWDAAADADLPTPLADVVYPPTAYDDAGRAAQHERITATEWAQPAIGTVSRSVLGMLSEAGVSGAAHAGHSYGELTALHAAGVLSAGDFVAVSRKRGELMAAAAATPGAMVAASADIEVVQPLAEAAGVSVANHNHPTQVVVSGTVDGIERFEAALAAAGLRGSRLAVATAFHSPVVSDAAGPFGEFLGDVIFRKAKAPVWSNSEAAVYPKSAAAMRKRLAGQIALPVRFVEQIEGLYAAGMRTFLEVGPGAVLTGLVGRILGDRPHTAVSTDRKGRDGVEALFAALGQLVASGRSVDLDAVWAGYDAPEDPRLAKKPKLALKINGSNYDKPYPPKGGAAALPPPNPPRPTAAEGVPTMSSKPTTPHTPAPPPAAAMPAAPAPVAAPVYASPAARWVAAYQEAQRQTAQAHAAFQQAMAQSHSAYLRAAEASFAGLTAIVTGQPVAPATFAAPAPTFAAPAPTFAAPAPTFAAPAPTFAAPAPAFAAPAPTFAAPAPAAPAYAAPAPPAPVAAVPAPPAPVVAAAAPVAAAPAPAAAGLDPASLQQVMLDVVAEKTGYPSDMLEMGMELEGDLGIDSIKRVEILSSVQEQAPGLPELDANAMASLRTLGSIVEYLQQALGVTAPPAAATAPAAAAPAAPAGDLKQLMLEVVAEKTGYPADMLELDMELEGDLGIDSIKRVEILAAVQERAPGMPEVDANAMSALRTLGSIVAYMNDAANGGDAVPFVPAPSEPVRPDLGRWTIRTQAAQPTGFARGGLLTASVVHITRDDTDLADQLAARLGQAGVTAEAVDVLPAGATAGIVLAGLRDGDASTSGAAHREGFVAARTLAATLGAAEGLFVTVQDTGGAFGLTDLDPDRAWLSGFAALARTAAQEWPDADVLAIDLQRGERSTVDLADALALELLAGGSEREVGLRADGERLVLVDAPATVAPTTSALSAGDVVVVSGGGRGVTAACVVALARATQTRFVLLGRTALADEPAEVRGAATDAELKKALLLAARARGEKPAPAALGQQVRRILAGREIRATVAAVASAGGEAHYIAADVQDRAALSTALADVRQQWGPIAGLIHGAGVLADRFLADKTDEQFARVFDTKVEGLRALLDATAMDPLKALVLFSSVAARCGNRGQSDYAIANEVLNKVAQAEAASRPGLRVRSLGWGPWEGGMVTPELKARFEALGVPLIPLAVGAGWLVEDLLGDGPVEQVLGGEPKPEALLDDGSGKQLSCAVHVSRRTHPYLSDHAIGGVPVVPVVLVVEWFVRAARMLRPDLVPAAVRSLKVLKGIRVEDFDGVGVALEIKARQLSNGSGAVLGLELVQNGRRHYSAQVRLTEAAPAEGPAAPTPRLDDWGGQPIYGDVLFHGDRFQVIEALDGVSDEGIAARLRGVLGSGWVREPWLTDVAAFDGGLQLALLWARQVLGGASLPTGIGEVRLHEGPTVGTVRCVLKGRHVRGSRASSDLVFVDDTGRTVAEFRGVETHLLPGASASKPTA